MSNFLLHKHRREDVQFKRPDGLNELLSDISREVLREQPECVYSFVADYLEAMMVTREQTLIAERTRNTIFDIAMTVSDMMRHVGVDRMKATASANLIEQSFRQTMINDQQDDVMVPSASVIEADILEKLVSACGFSATELHKVQKIIQVCFKDFYFREMEFTLKLNRLPYDAWANRVEKTLEIYRKSGPQRWELERAAIAIQAAYRGYYSRKQQHDLVVMNTKATAIQATFRGHLVRKRLQVEQAVKEERMYESKLSRASNIESFLINKSDNLKAELCERSPTDTNLTAMCSSPQPYYEEPPPPPPVVELKPIKQEPQPAVPKTSMDENKAATKIQALYRGHRVRKDLKDDNETSTDDDGKMTPLATETDDAPVLKEED